MIISIYSITMFLTVASLILLVINIITYPVPTLKVRLHEVSDAELLRFKILFLNTMISISLIIVSLLYYLNSIAAKATLELK